MRILAVTACPTGIAHTYMAAEALEREAVKRRHKIKVETQGSMGVENEITAKDVAEADVIIFAVDMNVLRADRFTGKPLVRVGVADAIKKTAKVLEQAEQAATN